MASSIEVNGPDEADDPAVRGDSLAAMNGGLSWTWDFDLDALLEAVKGAAPWLRTTPDTEDADADADADAAGADDGDAADVEAADGTADGAKDAADGTGDSATDAADGTGDSATDAADGTADGDKDAADSGAEGDAVDPEADEAEYQEAGERAGTGTPQREAWIAETWPPVEEVRADLWSMPVPIPENPLRYTLTYLIATDSELVVVDPGWDTDAGWNALADGLKAAGASPADVTGVVVTHIHPDHHGMSGRLRAASGAWVAMHPAERETLALLRAQGPTWLRATCAWLRRCGVPDDVAAELSMRSGNGHPFAGMVDPDRLLEHGDLVPLAAGSCARCGRQGTRLGTCACTTKRRISCSPAITCCRESARTSGCSRTRPSRRSPPICARSSPCARTTAPKPCRPTSTASMASRAGYACCSRIMNGDATR